MRDSASAYLAAFDAGAESIPPLPTSAVYHVLVQAVDSHHRAVDAARQALDYQIERLTHYVNLNERIPWGCQETLGRAQAHLARLLTRGADQAIASALGEARALTSEISRRAALDSAIAERQSSDERTSALRRGRGFDTGPATVKGSSRPWLGSGPGEGAPQANPRTSGDLAVHSPAYGLYQGCSQAIGGRDIAPRWAVSARKRTRRGKRAGRQVAALR